MSEESEEGVTVLRQVGQLQERELPRALNLERKSCEHLRWSHLEQVQHRTDLPYQVTFPAHTEQGAKTLPGADCRSDDQLLISKFELKQKTKKKTSKSIVFDLDNIIADHRVNTCNQFEILMHEKLEEVEPNCLW